MGKDLLTVEYSRSQSAYHVDFLEQTYRRNRADQAAGRTSDWELLYVTYDWDDAHRFIREHQVHPRRGKPRRKPLASSLGKH